MSSLKRDITATLGSTVFGAFIALGSAAILARVLGPANRGLLGLALLLPTTIATFCILGQDLVNVTYAGLFKEKRKHLFQQSLLLTFLGSVLSVLVICFFFFWLPVEKGQFEKLDSQVVLLTLMICPVLLLSRMLHALVRGIGKIEGAAVMHVIQQVTRIIFLLVFIVWLGYGLKGAVVVLALNPVVIVLMSLWLLRKYVTFRPDVFSRKYFFKSIGFGSQICMTNLASFLIYRIDQIFLGFMVSSEDVGFYVVAVSLAEQLRMLPNSISAAFLPRLSNDVSGRQKQVPMVFRCTMIVSGISMIFTAVLGIPLLLFVFGMQYLPSIPSFLLLLPGIAFLGGALVISSDLAAREKPKYSMFTGYITLGVNVILNFILIPWLGITGAAIASSISYINACCVVVVCYRRESHVPFKEMVPRLTDLKYLYNTSIGLLRRLMQKAAFRFRQNKQAQNNDNGYTS